MIAFLGIDWSGIITGLLSGLWDLVKNVFGYLINELVQLITWALSFIPTLPIWPGPSIGTAVGQFLSWAAHPLDVWNFYVPLNLWIVLAMTALAAESGSAIWHVIRWILAKIPFIGGEV